MGGAKKKSLKQAEKQQQIQTEKQQKPAKASKMDKSEKTGGLDLPEITDKELNELVKMKVLTPFVIATKYNIKLSIAKVFLKMLEKRNAAEQVANSRRLKIYKLVGNA